MPHAILEYSAGLGDAVRACGLTAALHDTLIACGLFRAEDIKTRAYATEDYLVGAKGRDGSFAHLTVFLLEGRSVAQKQELSTVLLAKLATLKSADSLTVDIRDMVKDTYRKTAT